ncbi:MAG: glutamate racemase [Armatimonadota bacterium]|nr:glutamate racemase [Armatimonadota bacterium]
MNPSPIGVFDSGLGGLTVAAQILKKLPNEPIIYLADTAHVPYGERPLEEIQGFALDITRFLRSLGCKMVVMACNMSSAVALHPAKEAFTDIPVLGVIEPGVRAAVRLAGDRPIGVMATTGTVSSHAYSKAIHAASPDIDVYEQACPAFVPLVESGKQDSPQAYSAAREYAQILLDGNVGTIILGCTHYPFLFPAIAEAAGPAVTLVDPAEETVIEIEKTLVENDIQCPEGRASDHRFFCTGDPAGFAELGSRFLRSRIDRVEQAVWGVDIGKVLA